MTTTPLWPGWENLPARKPIAVGAVLYTALIILWYVWHGTDIPPGISGLIETLIYVCVGGYAATSAYESVRLSSVKKRGGEDQEWRDEQRKEKS